MWYGCEAFITGSDRLCLDNRHGIFPKLNLIKMKSKNTPTPSPPTHTHTLCIFIGCALAWFDLCQCKRLLALWFIVLLHPVFDFIRPPPSGEIHALLFGSLCCFNMVHLLSAFYRVKYKMILQMKNIQDFNYACFIILFNFMWPSLFNHGKAADITYRQFPCLVVSGLFQVVFRQVK